MRRLAADFHADCVIRRLTLRCYDCAANALSDMKIAYANPLATSLVDLGATAATSALSHTLCKALRRIRTRRSHIRFERRGALLLRLFAKAYQQNTELKNNRHLREARHSTRRPKKNAIYINLQNH